MRSYWSLPGNVPGQWACARKFDVCCGLYPGDTPCRIFMPVFVWDHIVHRYGVVLLVVTAYALSLMLAWVLFTFVTLTAVKTEFVLDLKLFSIFILTR